MVMRMRSTLVVVNELKKRLSTLLLMSLLQSRLLDLVALAESSKAPRKRRKFINLQTRKVLATRLDLKM